MTFAPLAWAQERIAVAQAQGPIPLYGSPAWDALPPRDARRWAAVIIAAERHRTYLSPKGIALELADELAASRQIDEQRQAEEFAELAAFVRRSADRPTFAQLCDRRGEPERAARACEHEARTRSAA